MVELKYSLHDHEVYLETMINLLKDFGSTIFLLDREMEIAQEQATVHSVRTIRYQLVLDTIAKMKEYEACILRVKLHIYEELSAPRFLPREVETKEEFIEDNF